MSVEFKISRGGEKLADKLLKISRDAEQDLQKLVVTTTLLTQEALVDKITSDIEPHERDGETVTDLVDTGAYRASWQAKFPKPLVGKVATNSEYALALEYGREDGEHKTRGFFVARDVTKQMRREFAKRGRELLRKWTR